MTSAATRASTALPRRQRRGCGPAARRTGCKETGGSCQLCGWAPRRDYGADLCEAHHVRWLSRGGPDTLGNLALVCPNHHQAVHWLDAPYDVETGGFVFGATTEPLTARQHEPTV